MLPPKNTLIIHTGNLLEMDGIKTGQTSADELLKSLRFLKEKHMTLTVDKDAYSKFELNKAADYREMQLDDIKLRREVKTCVRIFVPCCEEHNVREALEAVFENLRPGYVDYAVLVKSERGTMENLWQAWRILEEYFLEARINSLGVSDMGIKALTELYDKAKVKPTAIHFYTAKGREVPSAVQIFTEWCDIPLLTHDDSPDNNEPIIITTYPEDKFGKFYQSDAEELLPDDNLKEFLGEPMDPPEVSPDYLFSWAVQYQLHMKESCVLCNKGYMICLKK